MSAKGGFYNRTRWVAKRITEDGLVKDPKDQYGYEIVVTADTWEELIALMSERGPGQWVACAEVYQQWVAE